MAPASLRVGWPAICAAGAAVVVAYFLAPGDTAKNAVYSALGIAAITAMLVAARRQPAHLRLGWYLIVIANTCFVVGDALASVTELFSTSEETPPTTADILYLSGYPFLVAGVVRISNLGRLASARETRADAALVSLGALTLSWHFLLQSYVGDNGLSLAGKIVTMLYPVMDIGVLYLVLYGIFSGAARHLANKLVGAAMCALVGADLAYTELAVHSTYNADSVLNAGFLASYVLFAAAAVVQPSTDPSPTAPTEAGHWLPLIGVAMFVPPGILLLDASAGAEVNVALIAAMSVVLTALAVVRASWLFDRLRNQAALLAERGASLHQAIDAQHALQEDLEHQASHDSLTGLANRTLLRQRIVGALGEGGTAAMCFCDLDGFKEVNDSLGHGVGDQLLVVVARRLAATVRGGDLVARLGGDEFAILLDHVDDPEIAVALAHRVVAVLQQPMMIGELQIQLTVSVGVAFAEPGSSTETLLSDADAAMYEAKAAGRNQLAVFESQMRERVLHRRAVMSNFEGSLERGQWLLEFQPHARLSDGALEGFEALVRWLHPTLGRLTPSAFIALAEETGFVVPLGRWVLAQACLEAARWASSPVPLSISVNVSGRQLQEPTLLEDVRDALAVSGLRPEQLILEITESVLVHNPGRSAAALQTIRELGVRIAIDDFGTGYSSLSTLSRLPVDILKIDKSFIDPLVDPHSSGAEFVEIILRLARHLRLATTAEGVEHQGQYDTLRRLRCDSVQGFLLSPPLSRAAARDFIERSALGPIAFGPGSHPLTEGPDVPALRK